ncbi:MAG: alpha-glucosidase C-terminal domain-containing protein [Limnohabitans sp.]|nr:alpha-glucosidase C-terminal domain-containing protein [Limnohabitans sp.]
MPREQVLHHRRRLFGIRASQHRERPSSTGAPTAYNGSKPSDEAYRRALLAVAVQMTYLGAPMIWYGDEVGMWGSDDPFCRKPMLWADLPPNDDPEERIREGHLAAYRALVRLRGESPALRRGAFRTLLADESRNLWVFERALGDERVLVVLNGSNKQQTVELPESEWKGFDWRVAYETDGVHGDVEAGGKLDTARVRRDVAPLGVLVLRGMKQK